MSSAYERLKAVIKELGYTSNEKFEDAIGMGHGLISRTKNRVSCKAMTKITEKFPQVNPSYIRTGQGEMFLSNPQKGVVTTTLRDRFNEYLKYKGISRSDFISSTGVYTTFPKIYKNGTFAVGTVMKINSVYPDFNLDWLASGFGDMINNNNVDELSNYKDRINLFCEDIGVSKTYFLRKCGRVDTTFSRFPDQPTPLLIKQIKAAYPLLNIEWLQYGKGKMFNDETKLDTRKDVSFVPLVPQRAYAGYLSGYADDVYISALPTIPIVKEGNDKYIAFEVSGDSMDDGSSRAYQDGDIVICKMCPDYIIKNNNLHYEGREFIIVHKEGILLKMILNLDLDEGTIVLHSFNPTYRDYKLNLADVRQILEVEFQQKKKS